MFSSGRSLEKGQNSSKHPHDSTRQQDGGDLTGHETDSGQNLRQAHRFQHQDPQMLQFLHLPAVSPQVRRSPHQRLASRQRLAAADRIQLACHMYLKISLQKKNV